jgi:hypothetical protein
MKLTAFSPFTRRAALVVAAAAVLAGGGSAVAVASSSPAPTVLRGCVSQFGGLLYDVTTNPGQQLRCPHDQQISWNQTGPQGLPGPAGSPGPAGPSGLTGLYWVSGTFGVAPGTTLTEEKACNPGDQVYGGGAFVDNPDGNQLIIESAPNGDLAGWDAGVTYVLTSGAVVKTLHVYALCGPKA